MKDKNKKSNIEDFVFYNPFFKFGHFSRSIIRILFYSFFIVCIGLVVSLALSEFSYLRWISVLIAIMFLDYLLHINKPLYSISDLKNGRVPYNNLAFCITSKDTKHFLNAFDSVESLGGDFDLHLILEMLSERRISKALKRLDIEPEKFYKQVEKELDRSKSVGVKLNKDELMEKILDLLIKSLDNSIKHGNDKIDSVNIFSTVISNDTSGAGKVLDFFDIDESDIDLAMITGRHIFSWGRIPKFTHGFAIKSKEIKSHRVNRSFTSKPTPILNKFSKDITDIVRAGLGGFLIGHSQEYGRLVDILSKESKRNAILVGDRGLGKETIVYRLAFNIISDDVPATLFDKRVVEFSLENMISTVQNEDLPKTIKSISNEISNAGNIVLYIPDIHNFSKSSTGIGMDLVDFLLPIIHNSSFPVVGSTTPKLFHEFVEMNPEFESSFEEITVNEISKDEAMRLLVYDSMIAEKKYGIITSFPAIKRIVELSSRYIKSKPLPSSAQDILSETIAYSTQRKIKVISVDDVESIVERKINVPIHKVSEKESERLLNLEEYIHKQYINQEEAVRAVSDSLRAYRSGLSDDNGPIATFLFVGPTGVGKTELSKILADIQFGSRNQMVRFDMSEYQQKKDVVRFIGSADGKIAGSLTEDIIHQPYSLILLDEFEKAHPDILNLFLQVFDDGRITDAMGRVVDFSNTIIIATSNSQSVFIQEEINKGKSIKDFSEDLKNKLSKDFKPELLNRFSGVIVFRQLDMGEIEKIAELKLNSLIKKLQEQGIGIEFDKASRYRIAELGYDPKFGARPIDRAINDNVSASLSKKILSKEISKGDSVKASVNDSGEIVFFT